MKAVLVREGARLSYEEVPDPEPGPGEVVVELKAAAVNRRDTYVRRNVNNFELPLIPGSDGAGIRRDTGDEIVILPSLRWGPREDAPGPEFEILGGPTDGTYAELIKVPAENLYRKPRRLSWEEAASFPLAGLTAYRALFGRARLRGGETVLVLGAGSGVSTFAVSLACQEGLRVLVTSSSDEKLERAKELGAAGGANYTKGDWVAEIRSLAGGQGVDAAIDSVGSTWPDSLRCLRPGGRLVASGATGGQQAELEVRPFYFGQYSLLGTTMGSPRDFAGLLKLIGEHSRWRPTVAAVFGLEEAAGAHERMQRREHFGKLVLAIG